MKAVTLNRSREDKDDKCSERRSRYNYSNIIGFQKRKRAAREGEKHEILKSLWRGDLHAKKKSSLKILKTLKI